MAEEWIDGHATSRRLLIAPDVMFSLRNMAAPHLDAHRAGILSDYLNVTVSTTTASNAGRYSVIEGSL